MGIITYTVFNDKGACPVEEALKEETKIGTVSIADDVVASIAGIAAIEVKGVYKLNGNITNELIGKLGKKNLANGVKVDISEGEVSVDISVELMYGNSVRKVSEEIQTKVKQAVETMTGLRVVVVNVFVTGIKLDN